MKKKQSSKIDARQAKQKELLLEQLRKLPIVQIACEKVGIARATYYRWTDTDATFKEQAEQAITEGAAMVNDLAEAQLISAIKDKNFPAISFWLRNRHKAYGDKMHIESHVKVSPPELSDAAAALVIEALQKLNDRREQIINSESTYESKSRQKFDDGTSEARTNESTSTTQPSEK